MIISKQPPVDLTYCTNVHAADNLRELLSTLGGPVAEVKREVCPDHPFGLGLWINAATAAQLVDESALDELRGFLHNNGYYLFTLNGFPYGHFHEATVKYDAYRPDWRTRERLDYTVSLGRILCRLLPEDDMGSVSTLPGSHKAWIQDESGLTKIVRNLASCALHFHTLDVDCNRHIILALEPEPDCLLETTKDIIAFFNERLLPQGTELLVRTRGLATTEAEAIIRRHIGICLDTCHMAVQFEDPLSCLKDLRENGIAVPKVQLSAALRGEVSKAALIELRQFVEPRYLHQVKARGLNGDVAAFADLEEALTAIQKTDRFTEMRCHFHVPLYFSATDTLRSTADSIHPGLLRALSRETAHWEIETYTFDVLPREQRPPSKTASIIHEFTWLLGQFSMANNGQEETQRENS